MASDASPVDTARSLVSNLGHHNYNQITIGGNALVHLGNVNNVSTGHEGQGSREQPFTVPFSRDRNFVPRDGLVESLLEHVRSDDHSRMGLSGMGGVGKTQIAIEFAYAFRESNADAAVFWVFAGSSERLLELFGQIAAELRLPGYQDQQTDVLSLVLTLLSDFRNGSGFWSWTTWTTPIS